MPDPSPDSPSPYVAAPDRYANQAFHRRCGRSGLMLPRVSLGLWQGFGAGADPAAGRSLVLGAFDLGITHFDLADIYGPPVGAAEEAFGRLLRGDLKAHRDEIVIATKAGVAVGPGPMECGGSRKHMLDSLDRSLRRLGLDRVDIFYSHKPDPETPLEETMSALAQALRSGKAVYAAVSNYEPNRMERANQILREMGTACVANQVRYNLFERTPEWGLFGSLNREGIGCVAYSPLAQGILAGRYQGGIPADSRAGRQSRFLRAADLTAEKLEKVAALERLARARGQTTAQMALSWVLRSPSVTTALIGASSVAQLAENVAAAGNTSFSQDEDARISALLKGMRPAGESRQPAPDTRSPFAETRSPVPDSPSPVPDSRSPLPETRPAAGGRA